MYASDLELLILSSPPLGCDNQTCATIFGLFGTGDGTQHFAHARRVFFQLRCIPKPECELRHEKTKLRAGSW